MWENRGERRLWEICRPCLEQRLQLGSPWIKCWQRNKCVKWVKVMIGFWMYSSDPCLATDCKYANKFHFHCLFGNCKYVCKTSGKAESHCLDHINPNNNLVNVRDQFAYYSLQCLCPNQVRVIQSISSWGCVLEECGQEQGSAIGTEAKGFILGLMTDLRKILITWSTFGIPLNEKSYCFYVWLGWTR